MTEPPVPVVVLIGAGASKASGDYGDAAPPLTRELFSTARARELLSQNRDARSAAGAVERLMADGQGEEQTLAFEAALRQLSSSTFAHHQRYAEAVPFYLHRLLLGYSIDLAPLQTRYDALVDRLLQLHGPVTFVSLNYDVLLDDNLDGLRPLNEFADYLPLSRGTRIGSRGTPEPVVPAGRGGSWALIKPHGSVAWHYDRSGPTRHGSAVGLRCTAIAQLKASTRLQRSRPALALPIGEKDELICPPAHLEYLKQQLDAPWVDLLLLGYSAIDTEVLDIIRSAAGKIRRMTVVNQDGMAALEVMRRLDDFKVRATWPDIVEAAYPDWVDRGGLRDWALDYDRVFECIRAPEAARQVIINRYAESERHHKLPGWMLEPMDRLGLQFTALGEQPIS